jgi:hypothetical protein
MSTQIFEAFDARGNMVTQYMNGAKMDRPDSMVQPMHQQAQLLHQHQMHQHQPSHSMLNDQFQQPLMGGDGPTMGGMPHGMDFFGGSSGMGVGMSNHLNDGDMMQRNSQRNPSIISFGGNGMRHMSFSSEAASFGRAMSGLSALSIDWENMDDFDINVDHSSHINNGGSPVGRLPSGDGVGDGQTMGGGGAGGRRSSLRRSFVASDQDAHVSFKV